MADLKVKMTGDSRGLTSAIASVRQAAAVAQQETVASEKAATAAILADKKRAAQEAAKAARQAAQDASAAVKAASGEEKAALRQARDEAKAAAAQRKAELKEIAGLERDAARQSREAARSLGGMQKTLARNQRAGPDIPVPPSGGSDDGAGPLGNLLRVGLLVTAVRGLVTAIDAAAADINRTRAKLAGTERAAGASALDIERAAAAAGISDPSAIVKAAQRTRGSASTQELMTAALSAIEGAGTGPGSAESAYYAAMSAIGSAANPTATTPAAKAEKRRRAAARDQELKRPLRSIRAADEEAARLLAQNELDALDESGEGNWWRRKIYKGLAKGAQVIDTIMPGESADIDLTDPRLELQLQRQITRNIQRVEVINQPRRPTEAAP